MTPKLNLINSFLDRFGYSNFIKHGFVFFIGGLMMIRKQNQDIKELQLLQNELCQFDINAEFEKILGPLRDFHIQSFFEEYIWRSEFSIETRKINVPNSKVTVSEYNFKNYKMLRNDETKIKKLFDAEICLNSMFEGIGKELILNEYNLTESYKSGMCFFNLKSQVDPQCTSELIEIIRKTLTPTLGCITLIVKSKETLFEGCSNIQIALACLVCESNYELVDKLWSFQSYVFYNDGNEILGVSDMKIESFIDHCRTRAVFFYNKNAELLNNFAKKQVHWNTFPALEKNFDERPVLMQAIQNSFGVSKNVSLHNDINLKTMIIFSYFHSICETALLSTKEIIIQ